MSDLSGSKSKTKQAKNEDKLDASDESESKKNSTEVEKNKKKQDKQKETKKSSDNSEPVEKKGNPESNKPRKRKKPSKKIDYSSESESTSSEESQAHSDDTSSESDSAEESSSEEEKKRRKRERKKQKKEKKKEKKIIKKERRRRRKEEKKMKDKKKREYGEKKKGKKHKRHEDETSSTASEDSDERTTMESKFQDTYDYGTKYGMQAHGNNKPPTYSKYSPAADSMDSVILVVREVDETPRMKDLARAIITLRNSYVHENRLRLGHTTPRNQGKFRAPAPDMHLAPNRNVPHRAREAEHSEGAEHAERTEASESTTHGVPRIETKDLRNSHPSVSTGSDVASGSSLPKSAPSNIGASTENS